MSEAGHSSRVPHSQVQQGTNRKHTPHTTPPLKPADLEAPGPEGPALTFPGFWSLPIQKPSGLTQQTSSLSRPSLRTRKASLRPQDPWSQPLNPPAPKSGFQGSTLPATKTRSPKALTPEEGTSHHRQFLFICFCFQKKKRNRLEIPFLFLFLILPG